jgi:hypothetical protein
MSYYLFGYPIQFYILGLLLILAGFLTHYFNRSDTVPLKGLKYIGIFISTMPIIGVAQGLIFRSKAKGYSEACFYQAAAGVAAYMLMKHVFKVVG